MKKKGILVLWLMLLMMLMPLSVTAASKPKINKKSVSLYTGETVKLKVTGAKGKVKWSTSKKSVAKVSSSGKVTAAKKGKATIKAKVNGKTLSCKVTVKAPALSEKKVTLEVGQTKKIKLNGSKIQSVSSNKKSVATIAKNGTITAKAVGSCKLTIKGKNKKKYTCNVTVVRKTISVSSVSLDRTSASLVVGEVFGLKASVAPADADNKAIVWSSSNSSVATVKDGTVTAVGAGSAIITAQAADGSGRSASCTVSVRQLVLVGSVSLDQKELDLLTGQMAKLIADIKPENADNKSVTWSSSNPAVATVKDGTVTAVGPGSANITVKANDAGGKSDVCAVTVIGTAITSPDQTDQIPALIDMGAKEIVIQSEADTSFVIPEGDFSDASLVVNVPNGEVTNQGRFHQVVVNAIAPNTFIEKAYGNTIIYMAKSGTIRIESNARARIEVNAPDSSLKLVNNGAVENLALNKSADVTITGEKIAVIPMTAAAGTDGSTVTTDKNLRITAEAKLNLVLNAGAERTTAKVTDDANIPSVEGLGSVTVENTKEHTVETVVAENRGESERKVSIEGIISDKEDSAVPGAGVYLLRYSGSINAEQIDTYLDGEGVASTEAGADGAYQFENVSLGNYYLVVKADGYELSVQSLKLGSETEETYSNGKTTLLPAGQSGYGRIKGIIKDAHTGEPIDFSVVLNLRKGRDNLSGSPLKTLTVEENAGGIYCFDELPTGTYTVQVISRADSKTNVIMTSGVANVVEGEDAVCDITVSAIISNDGMRFVLSWGAEGSGAPEDLDSHLVGPTDAGYKFHTWFSDQQYYEDDELIVDLDVDDTDYEGPETTTIHHIASGVYSFYVYDYSHEYSEEETDTIMSAYSDAVVLVYDADGVTPRATVNIPKGKTGSLWHVCDYDSVTGELTIVNTVGYWPKDDGENIGTSLIDSLIRTLGEKIETLQQLCDSYLTDGENRNEVLGVLAEARNIFENEREDEEALQNMIEKLGDYISALREQGAKDKIDNAIPLSLNTAVNIIAEADESLYYSYTPTEEETYTFLLSTSSEDVYSYVDFYDGYELYEEENYLSKGVLIRSFTMSANEKFTLNLHAYEPDEAAYTLYVVRGDLPRQLREDMEEVEWLCESRLEEDDPKRTEILNAVAEAEALLFAWDETRAAELEGQLEGYMEELYSMPDLSIKARVDGAIALELGKTVEVNAFCDEELYYSFTPQESGDYTFVVKPVDEDVYSYLRLYQNYDYCFDYDSAYRYGGIHIAGSYGMIAGMKYTIAISEDDSDEATYMLTVVSGKKLHELIERIEDVQYLLYEEPAGMDETLQAEVEQAVADASAMIREWDSKTWDEAQAIDMIARLDGYYQILSELNMEEMIGNAENIQVFAEEIFLDGSDAEDEGQQVQTEASDWEVEILEGSDVDEEILEEPETDAEVMEESDVAAEPEADTETMEEPIADTVEAMVPEA